MSEEKKPLENNSGENQNQNQENQGEDQAAEAARLKAENEKLQKDLQESRADVSKYQAEADRAKAKLNAEEQLTLREEALVEREHNICVSEIQRDYPDVFNAYPDAFDALKGSDKSEYINQAKYLQQGLDKIKSTKNPPASSDKGENKAENAGNNLPANNNDGAPVIPASGQNSQTPHIFTRAEIAEHKGDQEWYRANEAEINRQLAKGLIK